MGKGKTAGELVRMLRDCVGYGLYKERWDDDDNDHHDNLEEYDHDQDHNPPHDDDRFGSKEEDNHADQVHNDHDHHLDQPELAAKVRTWDECLQRSNSLCLLEIKTSRFSDDQ